MTAFIDFGEGILIGGGIGVGILLAIIFVVFGSWMNNGSH
jgi:hypothetical protein